MLFDPKKYDPEFVLSKLKRVDDTVLCSERATIYVPTKYENDGLVEFGSSLYTIGIYVLMVVDKWCMSSAGIMIRIEPSSYSVVKGDDDESYFAFVFDAGEAVIPNTKCVKNELLNYYVFQHMIYRGNVPNFMSVNDLATLYDTMDYYTGATVSPNFAVYELSVSRCLRSKDNIRQDVRYAIEKQSDLFRRDFPSIPIDTPTFTATNTMGMLLGPYMEDSVTNVLLNPSTRNENFEEIIRS